MTIANAVLPLPTSVNTTQRIAQADLEFLAAEAQTPEQHARIALYYESKAEDYLSQAHVHQAMIENAKADADGLGGACASIVAHCEYFVHNYLALAAKSDRMADMHSRLAAEFRQ